MSLCRVQQPLFGIDDWAWLMGPTGISQLAPMIRLAGHRSNDAVTRSAADPFMAFLLHSIASSPGYRASGRQSKGVWRWRVPAGEFCVRVQPDQASPCSKREIVILSRAYSDVQVCKCRVPYQVKCVYTSKCGCKFHPDISATV